MLRTSKQTLLLILCGWLFVTSAQAETARVAYVIDGDTVILEDERHIRLLAINTPEVEGKRSAEPGGEAAKRWLKQRIEGQSVRLISEQQKRDKYGRWLFYLFDAEGQLLNEALLNNGLAVLSVHPPNFKYLSRLESAQQYAETQKRGIWGMAYYQPLSLAEVMKTSRQGWSRVLVTPQSLVKTGRYHRLLLGSMADIRIAATNLGHFPDLQHYLGCSLEVRGWLSWHKGRLSILVRHPTQLIIKDTNQCDETLGTYH